MVKIEYKIGDCIELMKGLSNESMDMILTDPPFAISQEMKITRGKNTMKFKGKDINYNFGEWDIFKTREEFMQFNYKWWDESIRVCRKGGMFISFFDKRNISYMIDYFEERDFKLKDIFVWILSNPVPQARKVSWMSATSFIVMLQKQGGKLTYNWEEGQYPNYLITSICGGKERYRDINFHPTQKPEAIIEPFIRWWSNQDDWILDPFCGTGTTLAVAQRLGRNAIGFEIDKKWAKVIEGRCHLNCKILESFGEKDGQSIISRIKSTIY